MWWQYEPRLTAAGKKALGKKYSQELRESGRKLDPISISGLKIAKSFWGSAWCDNLERYSDFASRLPRGRTYARNGSILDLQISAGLIEGIVVGNEIYDISIEIDTLKPQDWKRIKTECAQSFDSLFDLLQGKFSDGIMERLTRKKEGLFPEPNEIEVDCDCPDGAYLCKHAAAVMYGVGARLDSQPELLFLLRNVDHTELISSAVTSENLDSALGTNSRSALGNADLGEMFGIDLENTDEAAESKSSSRKKSKATKKKRSTRKKAAKKKTAKKKTPAPAPQTNAVKKTKKKKASRKQTAKKTSQKKKTTKKKTARKK